MKSNSVRLSRVLRVMTVAGAGCAAAVLAIPALQDGSPAAAKPASASTSSTSSTSTSSSTTSSTTAPKGSVAPTGGLTLPQYTPVGTELKLSFTCPSNLVTNGTLVTAVTVDNVNEGFQVIKSYDVVKEGIVAYETNGDSTQVNWTWQLPSAVVAGTGLEARVSCGGPIDPKDTATFAKALTGVITPINKFIAVQFPAEAKPGDKIEVQVVCTRKSPGSFELEDKNGVVLLHNAQGFGDETKGELTMKSTSTGFSVTATIPKNLDGGDYKVQVGCVEPESDAVRVFPYDIRTDENYSNKLPLKVVAKKIPPTN